MAIKHVRRDFEEEVNRQFEIERENFEKRALFLGRLNCLRHESYNLFFERFDQVEMDLRSALKFPSVNDTRFKKAVRAAVAELLDQFKRSVRSHVRRMVWCELT